MSGELPPPERMRKAVADYVAACHAAYLRHAELLPPAVRGRLPLIAAGGFTVAAVGARYLHIIGTAERLEDPSGREAVAEQETGPLRWTLRFYDPVVLPALRLLDESGGPAGQQVRSLLGVRTFLYHLTVQPPAELGEHHAGHTGAGLAGAHAASAREFEAIRSAVPGREVLVDEMEGAAIAGLRQAQALLARTIAPEDAAVDAAAAKAPPDPDELRRAVLRAVRRDRSEVT
jgi:hypothetical protein